MTTGTTPQFEIPTDMRKMTKQSMEQVKAAIDTYLQFFKRSIPENAIGGSALSDKVFEYAERNVASAFDFAQRLAQVKNVQDIVMLQTEFMRTQMQAMAEQAKELGEAMTKALTDSMKTPPKGGLSS